MRYEDESFTDLDDARRGRHPRRGRSLSSRGAIYHLSARTSSRAKGQSARAAAAYIQRTAEYSRDQGDELVHTESGHMPGWAEAEPTAYWDAADLYERANGRLCNRLEFALPLALTDAERRALAVGFAHHLTDAERLPYTLAIHAGDGSNPHCHLMMSERGNDGVERNPAQWFKRFNASEPEKGGARKSTAQRGKTWLAETREAWAEQTNQALELAGHEIRIDHRSLEAQGVERVAGVHLGPAGAQMEARGLESARRAEARVERQAQQEEVEQHERREPGAEREPSPTGVGREGGDVGRDAGGLAASGGGERSPGLRDGPGAERDEGRGAVADGGRAAAGGAGRAGARDTEPAPAPYGRDREPGPGEPRRRGRDRAVGDRREPDAVAGGGDERGRNRGPEPHPAPALLVDRAARAGPGRPGDLRGGPHGLQRGVGRDDRGRATGEQQAETGPGDGDVSAPREQARVGRLIEAAQERAKAREQRQEQARRLIETAQERIRQEKQAREQERERKRERARDEGLER